MLRDLTNQIMIPGAGIIERWHKMATDSLDSLGLTEKTVVEMTNNTK